MISEILSEKFVLSFLDKSDKLKIEFVPAKYDCMHNWPMV